MNNTEMNNKLAEQVMGWKNIDGYWVTNKGYYTPYLVDGVITNNFLRPSFTPTTELSCALVLVNHLQNNGFCVFLQFTHDGNLNVCHIMLGFACSYPPVDLITNSDRQDMLVSIQDENMEMAICKAIIILKEGGCGYLENINR